MHRSKIYFGAVQKRGNLVQVFSRKILNNAALNFDVKTRRRYSRERVFQGLASLPTADTLRPPKLRVGGTARGVDGAPRPPRGAADPAPGAPMLALTQPSNYLTLKGSSSAASKPNVASKYALESSRRDLQNALLFTVLVESVWVKKCTKINIEKMKSGSKLNFCLKIHFLCAKFC